MRTHERPASLSMLLIATALLLVVQLIVTMTPAEAHAHQPGSAPTDENFARLRACESGGNYLASGRYHGAYQFSAATWRSLGYAGLAYQAPAELQDEAARQLQAKSGWGQWPGCSRRLKLR